MNGDLAFDIMFGLLGALFLFAVGGLGGSIVESRIREDCAAYGKTVISGQMYECKLTAGQA